ncbi:MAG: protease family protein [Nocardioidaceae bacterium]|nr:protease family protein [Nocardioidaceae bacterium]
MSEEWHQPVPTVPPPTTPPPSWTAAGSATVAPAVADTTTPTARRGLVVELVVMAITVALPGIIIGLRGFTDPTTVDTDIGVLELAAGLTAALGPAGIAVYLLWRDGRLQTAGFGRRSVGFIVGYGAMGFVCLFIALMSIGITIGIVTGEVQDAIEQQQNGEPADPLPDDDGIAFTVPSMLAAAAIALVAGVSEETLYRAYAITRLEQLGLRRLAVLIPGGLFALGHLYQGPLALLVIGALAAVFTWLYRWKRSVYPVMVAHALYDFTIFFILAAT